MRFAHISDLHFGSFTFNPLQFFSKRWLGNFNHFFTRKKFFDYNRLIDLIDLFKKEAITHLFITGDLSVSSRSFELKIAQRFIQMLEKEGLSVYVLPGNHDHYTKRAYRQRHFYRYFPAKYDPACPYNLRDHKVTFIQLQKNSHNSLWLIALDTAIATSFTSSQGVFSPQIEKNFQQAMEHIPAQEMVILINHFPFFPSEPPRKRLLGGRALGKLLKKYPNIFLYLHGHTHRQMVADLRPSSLPILSDSGSTPHKKKGGCHLFSLDKNNLNLDVYHYQKGWEIAKTHTFIR